MSNINYTQYLEKDSDKVIKRMIAAHFQQITVINYTNYCNILSIH